MTLDPISVTADVTLAEAAESLYELDIRHLPVVDDGMLVGILSDRDLRDVGAPRLLDIDDPDALRARLSLPVSAVMSTDVIAVGPDTDLSELVGIMIETKIGAIPIVDGATRRLVGIVSYIDLLRAMHSQLDEGG